MAVRNISSRAVRASPAEPLLPLGLPGGGGGRLLRTAAGESLATGEPRCARTVGAHTPPEAVHLPAPPLAFSTGLFGSDHDRVLFVLFAQLGAPPAGAEAALCRSPLAPPGQLRAARGGAGAGAAARVNLAMSGSDGTSEDGQKPSLQICMRAGANMILRAAPRMGDHVDVARRRGENQVSRCSTVGTVRRVDMNRPWPLTDSRALRYLNASWDCLGVLEVRVAAGADLPDEGQLAALAVPRLHRHGSMPSCLYYFFEEAGSMKLVSPLPLGQAGRRCALHAAASATFLLFQVPCAAAA